MKLIALEVGSVLRSNTIQCTHREMKLQVHIFFSTNILHLLYTTIIILINANYTSVSKKLSHK